MARMDRKFDRMDKPAAVTVAVARWVETARLTRNIPLNQLATQTLIPRNTLRRLLDGDPKGFTVPQLGRVAAVFGVELSDITRAAETEAQDAA